MDSIKTLQQAIIHFSEFENCKSLMMQLRWADGVVKCPHCGSAKIAKKFSTFASAGAVYVGAMLLMFSPLPLME